MVSGEKGCKLHERVETCDDTIDDGNFYNFKILTEEEHRKPDINRSLVVNKSKMKEVNETNYV